LIWKIRGANKPKQDKNTNPLSNNKIINKDTKATAAPSINDQLLLTGGISSGFLDAPLPPPFPDRLLIIKMIRIHR
jgi:hypothetical protein